MHWIGDVECESCGETHEGIAIEPVDLGIVKYPEVAEKMRAQFHNAKLSQYVCPHFEAIGFAKARNTKKVKEPK